MFYRARVLRPLSIIATTIALAACGGGGGGGGGGGDSSGSSGGNNGNNGGNNNPPPSPVAATPNSYLPTSPDARWTYNNTTQLYFSKDTVRNGVHVYSLHYPTNGEEYFVTAADQLSLDGLYIPSINVGDGINYTGDIHFDNPLPIWGADWLPGQAVGGSGSGTIDITPTYGNQPVSMSHWISYIGEEVVTTPLGDVRAKHISINLTLTATVQGMSFPLPYQVEFWLADQVGIVKRTQGSSSMLLSAVSGGIVFTPMDTSPNEPEPPTQPPQAPTPPEAVDPTNMAFITFLGTDDPYGSFFDSMVDELNIPANGTATVSLTAVNVQQNGVPDSYNGTVAYQNFDNNYYYGAYFLATRNLVLADHTTKTIGSNSVDRYQGGSFVQNGNSNYSIVTQSVVIGTRDGSSSLGLGTWRHMVCCQNGYFGGFPGARGSFIAGTASADSVIPSIASHTYSGYAYGGFEGGDVRYLTDFGEFTANATGSYNANSGQLTITLNGFSTYVGFLDYNFGAATATPPSTWNAPTPVSAFEPLACTATVSPSTNAFSCNLVDLSSNPLGTINCKFYGANASEVGCTFGIDGAIGAIRYYYAYIGALAMKMQ